MLIKSYLYTISAKSMKISLWCFDSGLKRRWNKYWNTRIWYIGIQKTKTSYKEFALIAWLFLILIEHYITLHYNSIACLLPFISITQHVHPGPGNAYLYIAVVKIRNLNDKLKKIMAIINRLNSRSSRPEVFRKKGVLKHFTKLTEKRQCRIILLIKIEVLSTSFLLWISRNF